MRAEKSHNTKKPPKTRTRRIIAMLVVAILIVLIFLMIILPPVFVSSEKGRKAILTRVNNAVAGQVDFASLSMSWLKGITATDISFKDNAGQTSVRIEQITTKPHYLPLLLGQLSFGRTVIDEPTVVINLKAGRRDVAEITQKKVQVSRKTDAVILPVKKIDLVVNNGNLKLTDSRAQTVEIAGINFTLIINLPGEYPAGQAERLLANLKAKANFSFAKAQYIGWDFGPTNAELQIKNGLLEIPLLSATVNNGRLNFAGKVDFNDKPALLKISEPTNIATDIQINDKTAEKLLMYLSPIFADAVNVSGTANFDCEKLAIPLSAAAIDDLELVGTVSITQLRLQPSDLLIQILSLVGTDMRSQQITIRPTRFILQNGFVTYEDMQMDIGDNPVNFKGIIGLDKSLNMTVTLPYNIRGKTARLDRDVVGKRISLPLKGTIDKPELDVDKLFEEQLRQQLEQTLRKGLEEMFK